MTLTRALGLGLFFIVALALALHFALLAAWHFSIEPGLERARYPGQLSHTTVDHFPAPAEEWNALDLEGLRVHAPLLAPSEASLAEFTDRCTRTCQIALEAGKLTVFDDRLALPFEAQIVELTPNRDEIGWLRTPWDNWNTIFALAARVDLPNVLPTTERFRAARSRGVITHFRSNDNDRWVIYAYATWGTASRKLALSGTSRDTLLALVGALEFAETP